MQTFRARFSLLKVLLLTLFVLVFALPVPLPFLDQRAALFPWTPGKSSSATSTPSINATLSVDTIPAIADPTGGSVLSHLTGVQLFGMPVELCLYNHDTILDDGVQVPESAMATDEADPKYGSLSVRIFYDNQVSPTFLYAGRNQHNCETFDSENKTLQIGVAYDVGTPLTKYKTLIVNGGSMPNLTTLSVDTASSSLRYSVIFDLATYIQNLFISLVALGLIVTSLKAAFSFTLRRDESAKVVADDA